MKSKSGKNPYYPPWLMSEISKIPTSCYTICVTGVCVTQIQMENNTQNAENSKK